MLNHPTPEDLKEFMPPPPPPAKQSDDEQDVGLATEMVFSGKRRQALRNSAAYETLQTGEGPSEDDEESYDDVEADADATAEPSTELLLTENHSELLEVVPQTAQVKPPLIVSVQQAQQSFGNYQSSLLDSNHYSHQPESPEEPFALTILILLALVALGILVILGLLIYRLVAGA